MDIYLQKAASFVSSRESVTQKDNTNESEWESNFQGPQELLYMNRNLESKTQIAVEDISEEVCWHYSFYLENYLKVLQSRLMPLSVFCLVKYIMQAWSAKSLKDKLCQ